MSMVQSYSWPQQSVIVQNRRRRNMFKHFIVLLGNHKNSYKHLKSRGHNRQRYYCFS